MKIKILSVLTLLLTLGKFSTAQSPAGVWKGTSLCQDDMGILNLSFDPQKKVLFLVEYC